MGEFLTFVMGFGFGVLVMLTPYLMRFLNEGENGEGN